MNSCPPVPAKSIPPIERRSLTMPCSLGERAAAADAVSSGRSFLFNGENHEPGETSYPWLRSPAGRAVDCQRRCRPLCLPAILLELAQLPATPLLLPKLLLQ